MGRSVSYHSNATVVAYFPSGIDDTGDEFEFDWLVDSIKDVITARFPSFYDADRWAGREDRVILENGHAEVSVAEYCGLVSVSLAVRDNRDTPELAESWTGSVSDDFVDIINKSFGGLIKLGHMSNGEGVYERAS